MEIPKFKNTTEVAEFINTLGVEDRRVICVYLEDWVKDEGREEIRQLIQDGIEAQLDYVEGFEGMDEVQSFMEDHLG